MINIFKIIKKKISGFLKCNDIRERERGEKLCMYWRRERYENYITTEEKLNAHKDTHDTIHACTCIR